MAYRDFKMSDLTSKFGVQQQISAPLFDRKTIALVEPSSYLKMAMDKAELFELSTEKAISERLVSPILAELKERNPRFVKLFSGEIINADFKAGLNGEIDFIGSLHHQHPIFVKLKTCRAIQIINECCDLIGFAVVVGVFKHE